MVLIFNKSTMEENMPVSTVYGPIASWRLGASLGVDLLCTEGKTCNLDCIYCQLGPSTHKETQRKEFISLDRLRQDLSRAKGVAADWVVFSGMGEPTLAANLGVAIEVASETLGKPVAVITNGTLLMDDKVRQELALADMVIVKLNASQDKLFQEINRPAPGISVNQVITGTQLFRLEYKGKLAIEAMLMEANKNDAYEISYIAKVLMVDQVQLNTPLRASACAPLTKAELSDLRKSKFWNANNLIMVYDAVLPQVTPLDEAEAEIRHPTKPKDEPVSTPGTPPGSAQP
jgi:wyosine [tRNA(Phe)-imidazoG37] synthetase (radical SAM superfamily)